MTPKVQLGTTPSLGVGRKDYSQGVEESVEPLISSYQDEYSDWGAFTVPAGADLTINFTMPAGKVVIGYDFFCQFYCNTLMSLRISAYRLHPMPPGYYVVFSTQKYGSIEKHITKGVVFYAGWDAVWVFHNYAAFDVDVAIGYNGLVMDSNRYVVT